MNIYSKFGILFVEVFEVVMKRLAIISFDALSSDDFEKLKSNKTVLEHIEKSHIVCPCDTVFVSNTYVIHSSVITGCQPAEHGIFSNVKYRPNDNSPDWHWFLKQIKRPTLFDIAKQNRLKTVSIMWPVSAKSGIEYNIPEIFANRRWKSQTFTSLFGGSFLFTLKMFLKHRSLLEGIKQPNRDDFVTEVFCDAIVSKKPELMLLHLTDTDTQKHYFGINSEQAESSIERMANRLEKIIDALKKADIYDETSVIVMSDHAQIDVEKSIDLNEFLRQNGAFSKKQYFEPCGGSAFFFSKSKTVENIKKLLEDNQQQLGFDRFLTEHELKQSGYQNKAVFGISAKIGTEFTEGIKHKATHGYTLDKPNYKPFYFYFGKEVQPEFEKDGKLTDIFELSLRLLGINKNK